MSNETIRATMHAGQVYVRLVDAELLGLWQADEGNHRLTRDQVQAWCDRARAEVA